MTLSKVSDNHNGGPLKKNTILSDPTYILRLRTKNRWHTSCKCQLEIIRNKKSYSQNLFTEYNETHRRPIPCEIYL